MQLIADRPNGFLVALIAACALMPSSATSQTLQPPMFLGAMVEGTVVTLTWEPPRAGSPSSYLLEVGSRFGLTDLAVFDTGNTATSLIVNAPIGKYFVRVRARYGSALSNHAPTVEVDVPFNCTRAPRPPYVEYSSSGQLLTLSWNGSGIAISRPQSFVIEAGTFIGGANIARATLPATGQSRQKLVVAVPTGAFFLRMITKNACGQSTRSNETLVVVGDPLPGTATGHWQGFVNASCAGDPACPENGFMGWALVLDIAHVGSGVFGTYRFSAVDYGLAPDSWGIVAGTLSASGAMQLTLSRFGPPESFGPNPGGAFTGGANLALNHIDGTLFPLPMQGIPHQNPVFVLTKRQP